MTTIRIQARVVTYDSQHKSILLVRNPGKTFWYVPGGGEEKGEDIKQCAVREMLEETGLQVDLKHLLYVQELHDKKDGTVIVELFWLAEPKPEQVLNKDHIDPDPEGGIEEAKWFTREQLEGLTVFPEELKSSFWDNLNTTLEQPDTFLGVFNDDE